jgi:signal transduction histidine kinase
MPNPARSEGPNSTAGGEPRSLFDRLKATFLAPTFFRQTPFRLTLVFITVYSFVAFLIFAYVYMASAAETRAVTDAAVQVRLDSLNETYRDQKLAGVVHQLEEDDITEWFFIKVAFDDQGRILGSNRRARLEITQENLTPLLDNRHMVSKSEPTVFIFRKEIKGDKGTQHYSYRGKFAKLDDGVYVYVASDTSWADSGFSRGLTALWGGVALVVLLGLGAGMLINQEVSRSTQRLIATLTDVQGGNIKARVPIRHSGDEFETLSGRINQMLDQMEQSMNGLKYAGDAIAHDLRTPLSRLRSKLELSLIEVRKHPGTAEEALARALDETDQLLRTFQTVFSIARLRAAGAAPDQVPFSANALAEDMAELFGASAEDKGLGFDSEFEPGITVVGNRDFLAQALANLLDNAIKYTKEGGITFRLRRTSRAEVEFSITDTGPGVPEADRTRIIERFVRLENSRSAPGVGLGLSMVAAVAEAHGGRFHVDEGPGVFANSGPGLRTALVLPAIQG